MKYREDKYGNKLSVLGFGCMRFKKKLGRINMKDASEVLEVPVYRTVYKTASAFRKKNKN